MGHPSSPKSSSTTPPGTGHKTKIIMAYSRNYAKQMRSSRKLAQWVDSHPNIINASIIIEALAAFAYLVLT